MSEEKNTEEELKFIKDSENKRVHVSMIFTHQARMRCFVRKSIEPIVGTEKRKEVNDSETTTREQILSRPDDIPDFNYAAVHSSDDDLGAVVGGSDKWKMPRFKNGSVLRCIITHDKIKLDLLVEGEIDENKPKYVYYVNHENVSNDAGALLGKYKVTAFDPMELRNTTYPIGKDDTYVFYIVRHGQATHNILKGITQKIGSSLSGQTDTDLTPEGTDQAKRSGAAFAKLFVARDSDGNTDYPAGNIALAPRYIFTSDLRRTRQTAEVFLHSLTARISNPEMAERIIHNTQDHRWMVLPCTHELAFVDSGYCDGFQKLLPTPPENQMTCDVNDSRCGLSSDDYAINWDHYSRFYGSSTRSKICKGCGARHCRDTDMINEAIKIIQPQTTPAPTVLKTKPAPKTMTGRFFENRSVQFAPSTKHSGGKTKRRRKNKKHKTRKSHTRKRLTRGKRKNAHKKVKKTKKSKK